MCQSTSQDREETSVAKIVVVTLRRDDNVITAERDDHIENPIFVSLPILITPSVTNSRRFTL